MMVQVACKGCGAKVDTGFPVPDDIRCKECRDHEAGLHARMVPADVVLHPGDYDPTRESDAARWIRTH